MSLYLVIAFLGASLLLYSLTGGPDFGAGILEFFASRKDKPIVEDLTKKAIGPIWEANHVWLIVIIVILFNGFPKAFSQLSISFHIPITLALIGIVLRGCAFVFRHFDTEEDASHRYYSYVFTFSSLLTPFFLGVVTGALIQGNIPSDVQTEDFYTLYLAPWLTPFSLAVGLFTSSLFTFLAASYLIVESAGMEIQRLYLKAARYSQIFVVLAGALVFFLSETKDVHLFARIIKDPFGLVCLIGATLALPLYWISLQKNRPKTARFFAGFQTCAILFAWLKIQFPVLLTMQVTEPLTLYNTQAPELTLRLLSYALLAASCLIFPGLIFLLKVFKLERR